MTWTQVYVLSGNWYERAGHVKHTYTAGQVAKA